MEPEPENVAIGRGVGMGEASAACLRSKVSLVKATASTMLSVINKLSKEMLSDIDYSSRPTQLKTWISISSLKWIENLGQWVILKGSLSSKKSGFHLPWQSVFAIIRPENKTPTYSKVINKQKT